MVRFELSFYDLADLHQTEMYLFFKERGGLLHSAYLGFTSVVLLLRLLESAAIQGDSFHYFLILE